MNIQFNGNKVFIDDVEYIKKQDEPRCTCIPKWRQGSVFTPQDIVDKANKDCPVHGTKECRHKNTSPVPDYLVLERCNDCGKLVLPDPKECRHEHTQIINVFRYCLDCHKRLEFIPPVTVNLNDIQIPESPTVEELDMDFSDPINILFKRTINQLIQACKKAGMVK